MAFYCQAWATASEAEAEIKKTGRIVKSPSGFPMQNPWVGIYNAAQKQAKELLAEFGLSPSARTRLKIEKPGAAADAFAAFIASAGVEN